MRDVYGPALRRERKRRGWTLPELARRLERIGVTDLADRTKLSKIEAQARSLTIEEWLTLSAVLEIPPAVLLSPYSVDRGKDTGPEAVATIDLDAIPEHSPHILRAWLEGRTGVVVDRSQGAGGYEAWAVAAARERWNDERWEQAIDLVDELDEINQQLGRENLDDDKIDELEVRRRLLIREIRRVEKSMQDDLILPWPLLYDDDAELAEHEPELSSRAGRELMSAKLRRIAEEEITNFVEAQAQKEGQKAGAIHAMTRLLEFESALEERRKERDKQGDDA